MEFLIADTFTDSLARLTGDEQKAVKTTAFDLQLNPANPEMQPQKLDRTRDKNFRMIYEVELWKAVLKRGPFRKNWMVRTRPLTAGGLP
ncbi:MAG TPA: hypothetical protein VGM05_30420 [Planctomycetaceae bacterium]|jgi:mRNA-degrading endonuclease RelE of RelBE toxin-antitoxin system